MNNTLTFGPSELFPTLDTYTDVNILNVTRIMINITDMIDNCINNGSCEEFRDKFAVYYSGLKQFYQQNNFETNIPLAKFAVIYCFFALAIGVSVFLSEYYGFYRFTMKRLKIFIRMIQAVYSRQQFDKS